MLLWIKGTTDDAKDAAAKFGVTLHDIRETVSEFTGHPECLAVADVAHEFQIMEWFISDTQHHAPYSPGSLLYYQRGGGL